MRIWTALLAAMLLSSVTSPVSADEAGTDLARTLRQTIGPVAEIRQECQTGSLIFSRGGLSGSPDLHCVRVHARGNGCLRKWGAICL